MASLLTPLVAASDPVPPPGSVWTVHTRVEAEVIENYAIVRVIADIRNQGPDPEFPFQVRVPEGAMVSGLTIERDGEVHEALVKERAVAREEYDAWKAKEETGGLVEKQRGSQVVSYLINVAEFTNVVATLTYEHLLVAESGVFHLPLEAPVSGFGRDLGASFDVTVRHPDGVTGLWAWQPHGAPPWQEHDGTLLTDHSERVGEGRRIAHSFGPRQSDASTPIVASYQLAPTPDEGSLAATVFNGTGAFAHRFRAPPDAADLPLDLVLVLDTSGSMSGLKIEQLRDAGTQVLQLLDAEDRIHLVLFSSGARSPWSGLRAADGPQRALAADEIRYALAAGGTNIEAGIDQGFEAFQGIDWVAEEGRMPLLVFLTDGQPTEGTRDRDALRVAAREANTHGIRVFALAFGEDADWPLVHGLASDGGGTALRVASGEGAEVDLHRFIAALTTPVLRDVTIAYEGEVTAHRRTADVLFAGSELLVIGTFPPSLEVLRGTVTARSAEGLRNYTFAVPVTEAENAPFLPRLVAHQEITRLQEVLDTGGHDASLVDAIVDLALAHGFVTDHTSLVVTLPAREVRPFDPELTWEESARWDADGASDASAGAPASSRSPTSTTGRSGEALEADTEPHADDRRDLQRNDALNEGTADTPVPWALVLAGLVGAALVARRSREV